MYATYEYGDRGGGNIKLSLPDASREDFSHVRYFAYTFNVDQGMAVTARRKVIVGSDDVYACAREAVAYLERKGFEVHVAGALKTGKPEPWPDVALEVAEAVSKRTVDFGVLVCYTGTGVSIVANKVPGVIAAVCNDPGTARGARLWNDANVLVMSGRLVTDILAREIIDAWLSVTEPDPSEAENISKLKEIDVRYRCREHA